MSNIKLEINVHPNAIIGKLKDDRKVVIYNKEEKEKSGSGLLIEFDRPIDPFDNGKTCKQIVDEKEGVNRTLIKISRESAVSLHYILGMVLKDLGEIK